MNTVMDDNKTLYAYACFLLWGRGNVLTLMLLCLAAVLNFRVDRVHEHGHG
jgi:hypothetical protein